MQITTWRSQLFRNIHKILVNSDKYLRSWNRFRKNWLFYLTKSSILCCYDATNSCVKGKPRLITWCWFMTKIRQRSWLVYKTTHVDYWPIRFVKQCAGAMQGRTRFLTTTTSTECFSISSNMSNSHYEKPY